MSWGGGHQIWGTMVEIIEKASIDLQSKILIAQGLFMALEEQDWDSGDMDFPELPYFAQCAILAVYPDYMCLEPEEEESESCCSLCSTIKEAKPMKCTRTDYCVHQVHPIGLSLCDGAYECEIRSHSCKYGTMIY